MTNILRVGVIGFSGQKFDEEKARELIKKGFEKIQKENPKKNIVIVSGLTNLGIPKLAYEEAVERGWETEGIASKKAEDYDWFDVDRYELIGDDWGDESETFLSSIDVLLKFGGGNQSKKEYEKFKGQKDSYDLEAIEEQKAWWEKL